MKREVDQRIFIALIAVIVVMAGWFLVRYTDSPFNRPSGDEAAYHEAEEALKKEGKDPHSLGLMYYKYHPEEMKNMPAGLGVPQEVLGGGPAGLSLPNQGQAQGQNQRR